MLRLPSVLHRKTEDRGHRGPGRQVPPQVRPLSGRRTGPAPSRPLKRAKLGFALFVCLFARQPLAGADPCLQPPLGEPLQVTKAFDGDTLLLADGRKVRLAGIDTPELAREELPEEPYARAALALLEETLERSAQRIHLLPARDTTDRYGRLLAHVYTPDGQSLQVLLLQAGLGLVNIQPPNIGHLDCYLKAENRARERGMALWRHLPTPSRELDRNQRGLALIQGRVEKTRQTRNSRWIILEGRAALRIDRADLADFAHLDFDRLVGTRVEARGWLHFYRNRPSLRIRHPAALVMLAGGRKNH